MFSAVDTENYTYDIGDMVQVVYNGLAVKVLITGSPKWRNWTTDGSYDYIYPVHSDTQALKYICEKDILNK